ncbi:MAG TPA: FUSC family protein [Candidatus Acidoferrales bacterium]|nr:FUSC family protein [Candidatus Acidoferrales bacterium]
MPTWIATNPAGLNRQSLEHAAKTAIASLLAIFLSRLLHLPEFYWAAIATMVVLQSTLGASLSISVLRLIGDAVGALTGAVLSLYFGPNVYVFTVGIFLLGLLTAAAHLDRSAFRFAGIALAVVMLVLRTESPWVVAWHRFSEIAVGIFIGLLTVLVWPERQSAPAARS